MRRTYTTSQGDKWDSIAFSQLGDSAHTDKLMSLNTAYRNYYSFPAGVVLDLPDIIPAVSDSAPPWKKVAG